MNKRIECHVEGRVQMVMYRDFAMRKAKTLGIVGTVQNKKDGRVFIVAEGEEEHLIRYVELLRRGSVLAHVERVDVRWHEPHGTFVDFSILYE
jgi:acylphosphatase